MTTWIIAVISAGGLAWLVYLWQSTKRKYTKLIEQHKQVAVELTLAKKQVARERELSLKLQERITNYAKLLSKHVPVGVLMDELFRGDENSGTTL